MGVRPASAVKEEMQKACNALLTPADIGTILLDSAFTSPPSPPEMNATKLLREAQAADQRGDGIKSIDKYMDLLELGGDYHDAVVDRLTELYPMGQQSRNARNHTDSFRRSMESRVRSGKAERVSEEPPIFVLHDLISPREAKALRKIARKTYEERSAIPPQVCYRHDAYTGSPELAGAWAWLKGEPGNGAHGCFTQSASRAVADSLAWSSSIFVHRGQSNLLDQLSMRVQGLAGLHDGHGHSWQLLQYESGKEAGYAEHTDCAAGSDLMQPMARMATLIVYASDDFDGGETEFPRLNLRIKPTLGSAILFYNYGPGWDGTKCSLETLHRSNPLTNGTKVTLQRYYQYLEQPFNAARPMPARTKGRLPFQPVVSCDGVGVLSKEDTEKDVNVSCRWYDSGQFRDEPKADDEPEDGWLKRSKLMK